MRGLVVLTVVGLMVWSVSTPEAPAGQPPRVRIPAGGFIMGCGDVDPHCSNGLKKSGRRFVTLDTFWIDRHEVTAGAFATCVEKKACTPAKTGHYAYGYNYGKPARAARAINGVTWSQAAAYCAWVGGHLPSEAQWEKAARGKDGRLWPSGNEAPSCKTVVMNCGDGDGVLPPGSSKDLSPYGVEDMAGNASEWVADDYVGFYHEETPNKNPVGSNDPSEKVIRGGAYNTFRDSAVVYHRMGHSASRASFDVGFRCAYAGK